MANVMEQLEQRQQQLEQDLRKCNLLEFYGLYQENLVVVKQIQNLKMETHYDNGTSN